jgi:hypothetical protein
VRNGKHHTQREVLKQFLFDDACGFVGQTAVFLNIMGAVTSGVFKIKTCAKLML